LHPSFVWTASSPIDLTIGIKATNQLLLSAGLPASVLRAISAILPPSAELPASRPRVASERLLWSGGFSLSKSLPTPTAGPTTASFSPSSVYSASSSLVQTVAPEASTDFRLSVDFLVTNWIAPSVIIQFTGHLIDSNFLKPSNNLPVTVPFDRTGNFDVSIVFDQSLPCFQVSTAQKPTIELADSALPPPSLLVPSANVDPSGIANVTPLFSGSTDFGESAPIFASFLDASHYVFGSGRIPATSLRRTAAFRPSEPGFDQSGIANETNQFFASRAAAQSQAMVPSSPLVKTGDFGETAVRGTAQFIPFGRQTSNQSSSVWAGIGIAIAVLVLAVAAVAFSLSRAATESSSSSEVEVEQTVEMTTDAILEYDDVDPGFFAEFTNPNGSSSDADTAFGNLQSSDFDE
jgi:hypothetical protein